MVITREGDSWCSLLFNTHMYCLGSRFISLIRETQSSLFQISFDKMLRMENITKHLNWKQGGTYKIPNWTYRLYRKNIESMLEQLLQKQKFIDYNKLVRFSKHELHISKALGKQRTF